MVKFDCKDLQIVNKAMETLVIELKQRDKIIEGLRSVIGDTNFREMLRLIREDWDNNPIPEIKHADDILFRKMKSCNIKGEKK